MGSGDVSPTSVSPSVREWGRENLSWVGEEMNPGLCASLGMQIALQVLSINYRAWASRQSCRENRPLAPIKFNGVWTPNSLSLFENQNPSFFRNVCGQVKSLVPLQTARFLPCWQRSPPGTGMFFLVPSVGSGEGAGGDVQVAEVWAGSSVGTTRNPALAPWHHCAGWFTTPSWRLSCCRVRGMGMGSPACPGGELGVGAELLSPSITSCLPHLSHCL